MSRFPNRFVVCRYIPTKFCYFFQIGSDKLNPQIAIPSNTIQNGPDAVAIYRSDSPPSNEGLDVPTKGLLDAIVYRSRGSDKDTADLIRALMPRQLPLLEYFSAQEDKSLSRCGLHRLDLNSFRVRDPIIRLHSFHNICCGFELVMATYLSLNQWVALSPHNRESGVRFPGKLYLCFTYLVLSNYPVCIMFPASNDTSLYC